MTNDEQTAGFTLIELMITLVIGMVILAGLSSVFVNNSRLSNTLADRTERMGDLYTVSHIMQTELRSAQAALTTITQGMPTRITYTPAGSNCPAGYFEYRKKPGVTPAYYELTWKRPENNDGTCNNGTAQQVIRDLDPVNGMVVTALGTNPYANAFLNIDLYSLYQDQNQAQRTVSLSFKVWSRN